MRNIILAITTTIIIAITLFFIYDNPFVNIKLKGNKNIEINYKEEYKELGVTGSIFNKKLKVKTNSNYIANKIGKYKITYELKYFLTKKMVYRNIIVIDNISPIIKIDKKVISLKVNDEYKESNYSAYDDYDKTITDKIKIDNNINNKKSGTYEVIYKVSDSSNNSTEVKKIVHVYEGTSNNYNEIISGPTYIKDILIVNKKYNLPSTYNKGIDKEANEALLQMQQAAKKEGLVLNLLSSYRSYNHQNSLYNNYVSKYGQLEADKISARAGHSEHQTGLSFDIGTLTSNFGSTKEGLWLKNNSYKYGFIIRYPKNKTHITGYSYEPWHIRYLNIELATYLTINELTLEEYLEI